MGGGGRASAVPRVVEAAGRRGPGGAPWREGGEASAPCRGWGRGEARQRHAADRRAGSRRLSGPMLTRVEGRCDLLYMMIVLCDLHFFDG